MAGWNFFWDMAFRRQAWPPYVFVRYTSPLWGVPKPGPPFGLSTGSKTGPGFLQHTDFSRRRIQVSCPPVYAFQWKQTRKGENAKDSVFSAVYSKRYCTFFGFLCITVKRNFPIYPIAFPNGGSIEQETASSRAYTPDFQYAPFFCRHIWLYIILDVIKMKENSWQRWKYKYNYV